MGGVVAVEACCGPPPRQQDEPGSLQVLSLEQAREEGAREDPADVPFYRCSCCQRTEGEESWQPAAPEEGDYDSEADRAQEAAEELHPGGDHFAAHRVAPSPGGTAAAAPKAILGPPADAVAKLPCLLALRTPSQVPLKAGHVVVVRPRPLEQALQQQGKSPLKKEVPSPLDAAGGPCGAAARELPEPMPEPTCASLPGLRPEADGLPRTTCPSLR